jgi:hypothetical protein
MVQTVGQDPGEQKVVDDVAKFGWHCVNILAEGDLGPYSFTIGLQQSYGHSELIIFGLPSKVAHEVLNIAIKAIQNGAPIDLSSPTDQLLEGYPCLFVKVPESEYYEHVGFCRWYYQGNNFTLHQIVWPTRDGHFPWHPSVSESFRANQPVLGHPSPGT